MVVLFGEALQELGVLAHRVIGGQGGIDKGSVVSLVKDLLADNDEGKDKDGEKKSPSTGIILANTGERWWWPQGQRSLCHRDSLGVKMKSCVHNVGSFDPMVNLIPGSEDVEAHVKSIFERVLRDDEGFVNPEARVQAIAVGEAATAVETYLDKNWELWKGRIDCLAMLGNGKPIYELNDGGFKKFLREVSGRNVPSPTPLHWEQIETNMFRFFLFQTESPRVHHYPSSPQHSNLQPGWQPQEHELHLLRLSRSLLRRDILRRVDTYQSQGCRSGVPGRCLQDRS